TWRGTLIGCGLLLLATAVIAGLVTDADAAALHKMVGTPSVALALRPLVGFGGQISLCQMSFAGIGALVMAHHGCSGNLFGLLLAGAIAGVVGGLVALPALRLSGIYLALATGAFA